MERVPGHEASNRGTAHPFCTVSLLPATGLYRGLQGTRWLVWIWHYLRYLLRDAISTEWAVYMTNRKPKKLRQGPGEGEERGGEVAFLGDEWR